MNKSWRGASDEWSQEGHSRMSQSHNKLAKRMSLLMQDTDQTTSLPWRKVSSQGNMSTLTLPFVRPLQVKPRFGDTSDDSDKEEHIVKIDSPSALFHTAHSEP